MVYPTLHCPYSSWMLEGTFDNFPCFLNSLTTDHNGIFLQQRLWIQSLWHVNPQFLNSIDPALFLTLALGSGLLVQLLTPFTLPFPHLLSLCTPTLPLSSSSLYFSHLFLSSSHPWTLYFSKIFNPCLTVSFSLAFSYCWDCVIYSSLFIHCCSSSPF